tara:strand:+ start:575 stop:766 length:192 start_codon:yes stop_codon:yes gene_type:complete
MARQVRPLPSKVAVTGNQDVRLKHLETRLVQIEARIKRIEDKIVTAIKVGNDRQGRQYIVVKR